MEFSIEQALEKAIIAQKSGAIREADLLYTAILKAQPKHPDANHNLGLIAVEVGKVESALPFFKTAIEANHGQVQFWLSYIDALTKLNRFTEAKTILKLAKKNNMAGHDIDILGAKINHAIKNTRHASEEDYNTALTLLENGKYTEAIELLMSSQGHSFENAKSLSLIAHCYLMKDEVDKGSLAHEKAKRIDPDLALVGWNEARIFLKKKKPHEALKIALSTHKKFPNDTAGLGILGACLRANGKLQEGLAVLNQAILNNARYAEAYMNRGLIHLGLSNKTAALSDFNLAHQIKPHMKQIWDLLVWLSIEQKLYSQAINTLVKMIEISPHHPGLISSLIKCIHKTNDTSLSISSLKKIVALMPNNALLHSNLGILLAKNKNLDEALVYFNQAITLKPDSAEAYNNIGNILLGKKQLMEASDAYQKAISINPDYPEALSNLGNIFQRQGMLEQAVTCYNKAISINPHYHEVHNNLGIIFHILGKLDQSIASYTKALSLNPQSAEIYNNMGNALADQGELDRAREAYSKAISVKPYYTEAHRHLSMLTKYKEGDSHITVISELLKSPDLDKVDKYNLLYTNAKINEDLGRLDVAFHDYVKGGSLKLETMEYDFQGYINTFEKIKCNAPFLKKFEIKNFDKTSSFVPIFILGMPRSGTSIVEQIVASHHEVFGAGELSLVQRHGLNLAMGTTDLTIDSISKFRTNYLEEIAKLSGRKRFITDKMPQNFRFIGLICAALPEAKIIHVQRDARAVCWSNFKHLFSLDSLGYSYKLEDTIRYYNLYTELMDFWNKIYGDRIYNLQYELLTENQEVETRRLIKYLDLNWDVSCLSPQDNKRSVRTASQQQVRQKLYQGSSFAWLKYQAFLQGFFEDLKPPTKFS